MSTVDRPEYGHLFWCSHENENIYMYVCVWVCARVYDDCMTCNKLAAIATLHHLYWIAMKHTRHKLPFSPFSNSFAFTYFVTIIFPEENFNAKKL